MKVVIIAAYTEKNIRLVSQDISGIDVGNGIKGGNPTYPPPSNRSLYGDPVTP